MTTLLPHLAAAPAPQQQSCQPTSYDAATMFHSIGSPMAGGWNLWSNGYVWGSCTRTPVPDGVDVELNVLYGTLALRQLIITGVGAVTFELPRAIAAGEKLLVRVKG